LLAEEAEEMGTVLFPGSSSFYRSRKSSNQVITHAGVGPLVASLHDFLMEANHIVAPRLPPLKQIGQIGVEPAHIGTACGLRIGGSLQPVADGALTNAHPLGNSGMAHPKFAQSDDLLITGQAFLSVGKFPTLHLGGTSDRPRRLFYGNVLCERFLDFLPTAAEA